VPFFGTDTYTTTVMGQFTWSFIAAIGGSGASRRMVSNKVCLCDYAIVSDLLVSALSQNPVAAPPYSYM